MKGDGDEAVYGDATALENADDASDQLGGLAGAGGGFDEKRLVERLADAFAGLARQSRTPSRTSLTLTLTPTRSRRLRSGADRTESPSYPAVLDLYFKMPASQLILMPFDHERLNVYQLALDFMAEADGVIEKLPRGRRHLAEQLSRASTSIVLNIAEGAGKFSKPDKNRFYQTAAGSTSESAAILDVLARLELIDSPGQSRARRSWIESWACS